VSQLGFMDEEQRFVVEPGKMQLMIARSSEQIDARLPFVITGEKRCLKGERSYTCRPEIQLLA
jgi:hypothetical protein